MAHAGQPNRQGRHDLRIVALWIALALPAAVIVGGILGGQSWRWGIGHSGDVAAKLLVIVFCISPLRTLSGDARWSAWLARQRRTFGLATFAYGALHLAIFIPSIGRLDWIIQGMAYASMWTGWIAIALLAAIAAISSDRAHRALGPWWKRMQRLVYPAGILVLAHWLLLSRSPLEPLLHLAPVLILRAAARLRLRKGDALR